MNALANQPAPPEVSLSAAALRDAAASTLALPLRAGRGDDRAHVVDESGLSATLDVDWDAVVAHHRAVGRAGEVIELPLYRETPGLDESVRTVLLVGVGTLEGPNVSADLRRAGAALARRTKGQTAVATTLGTLCDRDSLGALIEGLVLGSFGFHRRVNSALPKAVERVILCGLEDPAAWVSTLEQAMAIAGAGWLARTLALVPSNEKNPQWLAERAEDIAAANGLTCEIWDETELAERGFGGLLAVGGGSISPPRLVRLEYTPTKVKRKTPHLVLVGKGITFDSGGYSIKPAEAMATMKRDMTGAGVVLAVMAALREVGCPIRVTGLLACAENSVSGSAMRPGDVIKHFGGRTTEVTNTDAEGRLVLADGIAYSVSELAPDAVVDVATLTGAAKVALGQRTGALFGTIPGLNQALLDAGQQAGEPLWELPLAQDYAERLDSPIADADNAASGPGAIMAALFLQAFVDDVAWAHLDIASVGDSPVDAYEWSSGATGFGARLLLHWLASAKPLG